MAGNIQRRPDGKWRARYRDANHREHARHFPRKRDAERWLASQVAIARGEWVDPTSPRSRSENGYHSGWRVRCS
jgi:hypothetical protein